MVLANGKMKKARKKPDIVLCAGKVNLTFPDIIDDNYDSSIVASSVFGDAKLLSINEVIEELNI